MISQTEASRQRRMWFGSYTRAGELKKVEVWCFANQGRLEFLTHGDSLKAKRAMRNPNVVCFLGSPDGPKVEGTAEVIRDPAVLQGGLRAYWRTHPLMMLLLNFSIRRNVRQGKQVLIRITPGEPNPLAGFTDPRIKF